MSARTVLITSSYYWPETLGNAPYVTGLAEHLSARGDDVVVVTGFPHYPAWRLPEHTRPVASEVRAGVRLRRRWHYVPGSQSAARRALYEGSFLAVGLTAIGLRRRPDVILGISPTLASAALAAVASRVYRRPYGLVFQDLMGRAAEQALIKGGSRVSTAVRRAERELAAGARAIGVVSEGFRRYFIEAGIDPGRVHRLRNWTQVADEPSETVEETRARLGWQKHEFVCLHSGSMGHKQGLENVLEAARLLPRDNVTIVLAGDGNERRRLERHAAMLGLTNVEFVPVQPPGRYEAMLRAADLLVVNQRRTVTDMSLASRLTSYFAAGRPVIAAVAEESETGREILAARAGHLVPPDEPPALASAILALRELPRQLEALGLAGRRYAAEKLTAASALEDYERFVDRLMPDST